MAQVEGLSFVEIGRRLGVSVTTVRKHFVRAMTDCLMAIDG
jgi:RNA polymerase sigma-70 factor (ECF subfamily)